MKILFCHKGYPGQFKYLIKELYNRGHELLALLPINHKTSSSKDIKIIHYPFTRGNGSDTDILALETETKCIRGYSLVLKAQELLKTGYSPDIIISHPGWGECLFLDLIWPKATQIHYVEYIYGCPGTDFDFIDIYAPMKTIEYRAKEKMKNANMFLNLNQMSLGICPTYFQYSTIPEWARPKVKVIHDGIDTMWACPDSGKQIEIDNNLLLKSSQNIITFVNRTFEPYRGIHMFIEALCHVMNKDKDVVAILVGKDTPSVSYGQNRNDKKGWFSALKEQYQDRLDWHRVHNLGVIEHNMLRDLFQVSSVHVYLSYPFVVSWSLLEAMSCGCLVIGSDTLPVREFIKDGVNGLLVPFDNPNLIAEKILFALDNKPQLEYLGKNARSLIVGKYDLKSCLKKQVSLIERCQSLLLS